MCPRPEFEDSVGWKRLGEVHQDEEQLTEQRSICPKKSLAEDDKLAGEMRWIWAADTC